MARTVFLAGGSGFIGTETCGALAAAGDTVLALCRSQVSGLVLRAIGAEPVAGDLREPGTWCKEAARADYVVHLAQPEIVGGRISCERAKRYRREREAMDTNLFRSLDPGRVKRVIYVSGTSYYGNLGTALKDETAEPRPHGIGRYIAEIVECLGTGISAGIPLVSAFPGYVYGPGSWFEEYVFRPLVKGKRLVTCTGPSPFCSPVHVEDCGRAIAYLLDHGSVGERYFIVDDKPVRWFTLQALAADALGVAPRFLRLPKWGVSFILGRIMTESLLETNCVLSNVKLKRFGFTWRYPTIDTGIPAVVEHLLKIEHTMQSTMEVA